MKRKTNQALKRANRLIKGVIISWDDHDPMAGSSDIENGKVTHRNPVTRLGVNEMWDKFGQHITRDAAFHWKIHFHVDFGDYLEERDCIQYAKLTELASALEPHIDEALACGENPIKTHFEIECVGIT